MWESLIEEYESGARSLEALTRGIPESARLFSPAENAWSIHEILIHLSDAEIVYSERLRRAIGDDDAAVVPFDESAWGDRLCYSVRDAGLALALLRALRAANANLLRRLDAPLWDRTIAHPANGPMTVAGIVRALVEHMDYHLEQIRRIQALFSPETGASTKSGEP